MVLCAQKNDVMKRCKHDRTRMRDEACIFCKMASSGSSSNNTSSGGSTLQPQNVLQRCANTLLEMVNELRALPDSNNQARSAQYNSANASEEFSRLFSPRRASSLPPSTPQQLSRVPQPAITNQNSTRQPSLPPSIPNSGLTIMPRRFSRGGKSRATGGRRNKRFDPAPRQSTMTFMCLGSKSQSMVPDTNTKVALMLAGLGEKRMIIRLNESFQDFQGTLFQSFPKLKEGGGFEILRTERNCKQLILIPQLPEGYHGQYIKTILNQGKGYIRPLQCDIDESCGNKECSENDKLNDSSTEEAGETCLKCGDSFLLTELRGHVFSCTGKERYKQVTIEETIGNSSKSESSQEIEDKLFELFPDRAASFLQTIAFMSCDIAEAVDMVTKGRNVTAHDVIERFKKSQLVDGSHFLNITDRDTLWKEGLTFYKCSLADRKLLQKRFFVDFTAEIGIDAGAIKVEFFSKFFEIALRELFEERSGYYIPKRSGGNLMLFKIVGVAMAHSILQQGPEFNILHPYCYSMLLQKNDEEVVTLISPDVIPVNAGTASLLQFMELVNTCNSDKEIEDLFNAEEGPAFEQIVNGSQWDICEKVTSANKETLLSMLVSEELIGKRDKQIKALREGLKYLQFFEVVKRNEALMKDMFVANQTELTAEQMLDIFNFDSILSNADVVNWFKDFVRSCDLKKLRLLLKFCTSLEQVPIYSDLTVTVNQMEEDEGVLPKANVCATTLRLPIVHKSYDDFAKFMAVAIECEAEGFFEP